MKTKRSKRPQQRRTTLAARADKGQQKLLFADHVRELRRRVMYTSVSVVGLATGAYFVQQHIVALLLKPAGRQQFIYTSPGGGMNFLVSVCLNTGIVLSIPVIIYNILKFIEPLLHESSAKFIRRMSIAAAILALGGICFGYFLGLPHTLQFLAHQFQTSQIKALISIQSYMGFVSKFLLGSALIFQAPLILLLVNKIKPLKPATLFKYERWVILASFILGGILSPTPDIRPMLLLSLPMILMYQIGIAIIWKINRTPGSSAKVLALLEQDVAARAERLAQLEAAILMPLMPLQPVLEPVTDETPPVSEPSGSPLQEYPAEQTTPITLQDGRRNYDTLPSGRRQIRRKII